LVFGWPPLDEQRRVVDQVGVRTRHIDALKGRLEAHIDKLREYRQALITAAVTGKIDLSKEAA
jgi:type I restriction enzyme S subunit